LSGLPDTGDAAVADHVGASRRSAARAASTRRTAGSACPGRRATVADHVHASGGSTAGACSTPSTAGAERCRRAAACLQAGPAQRNRLGSAEIVQRTTFPG
jgi:hypothetical protein